MTKTLRCNFLEARKAELSFYASVVRYADSLTGKPRVRLDYARRQCLTIKTLNAAGYVYIRFVVSSLFTVVFISLEYLTRRLPFLSFLTNTSAIESLDPLITSVLSYLSVRSFPETEQSI